jgi:hypothetical protein
MFLGLPGGLDRNPNYKDPGSGLEPYGGALETGKTETTLA